MEKLANSLNKRFVSAGLDRVVPKKTHAIHTVGEKIDALQSAASVFLEVPGRPFQLEEIKIFLKKLKNKLLQLPNEPMKLSQKQDDVGDVDDDCH